MEQKIKKRLFAFLFIILLLPLVQECLQFEHSGTLFGAFTYAPDATFSGEGWFDGSYQKAKGDFCNDHMGFRPDLIRLTCQLDYSLFRKLNTGWGVLCKDNCVIDRAYVDAWNGADYQGYEPIHTRLVKLKAIQDTLARLGKSVILVHPASKGFFYAELMPDKFRSAVKRPTNYGTCVRIADSLGINQVDLNSWICAIKDTSKELLYSKQGIHWTSYGGLLAGDSLVRYIERLRHISMPHMHWRKKIHTTKPEYPDNDIGAAMNLIWPIATETFTYGDLYWDSDSTSAKPRAIYIGDSFTWAWLDNYVFDNINSKWEFWFYMKELHTSAVKPREPQPMENYDWQAAIDKADYIVLNYNASNITQLGNGFIEKAYDHYFPVKK